MLWEPPACAFFGFHRMGEVVVLSHTQYNPEVPLSFGDVEVNSESQPRWLEVRIKASKTDPFHHKLSIYAGATGGTLCPVTAGTLYPVTAVLAYLVQQGTREGPFL